jgi:hypothetical protein
LHLTDQLVGLLFVFDDDGDLAEISCSERVIQQVVEHLLEAVSIHGQVLWHQLIELNLQLHTSFLSRLTTVALADLVHYFPDVVNVALLI